MTSAEESLLLYLDTRAVDHGGRITDENLNNEDRAIARQWAVEGYIGYGRIKMAYCQPGKTTWVRLSPKAHDDAAKLRRARAVRGWNGRNYEPSRDPTIASKLQGQAEPE
jgi:hypothetical protein